VLRARAAATVVVMVMFASAGAAGIASARPKGPPIADPCAARPLGHAHCNILVLTDATAWRGMTSGAALKLPPLTLPRLGPTTSTTRRATTTSSTTTTTVPAIKGFGPADLRSAYGLTTSSAAGGANQVIAVIEGASAPSAENDLAVYRSHFGLSACTRGDGCLRIVDQNGGSSTPSSDDLWALETAADLDMASAICPGCKLLVVQANTDGLADMAAANATAAQLGATVINNSWGWADSSDPAAKDDSAYAHAGAVTVAASGDFGYSPEDGYPEGVALFPAASPHVVAVGGTSLIRASSTRGWAETAFDRATSGCATVYDKPSWQAGVPCSTGRGTSDVAAVADPLTGVAVYDSTGYGGKHGLMTAGGTSVSSAVVAGVYALASNAASLGSNAAAQLYLHESSLNDVTAGNNGSCPDAPPRCNAGPGWDGPTGNGTPEGTSAF
jgi:subtilase family serine protease